MLNNREIERTEKEKIDSLKEIMNNIAHQWRQPLSQINSTVSLIDKILYDKNIQEPLLEEKLQEIESLTKYMSNTIDDFRNENSKTTVILKNIVNQAIDEVEINLREHKIEILKSIDVDYSYYCYNHELKHIIIVLLNNAKDALLDRNIYHAKIYISIIKVENEFMIKICDNAGGITKSVKNRMFEQYYTTKHKSQGTGFGLYMSRKIIQEKLHGKLDVRNVDEGSCFSIYLPNK